MQRLDPAAVDLVKRVVELLVAGEFGAAAQITGFSRLSTEDIAEAIRSYGRTLVVPPSHVWQELDIVRVAAAADPTWSVVCDLWTLEEGRSDLSLVCTVAMPASIRSATIEIDGVYVR
ncbi:MAG: hypothetical protein EON54_11785 [Alcaligenaceae bacterium]|nr:MAG: hypothetical protein EON54_11785 [Alcaligenaceae bacterium]